MTKTVSISLAVARAALIDAIVKAEETGRVVAIRYGATPLGAVMPDGRVTLTEAGKPLEMFLE